MRRPKTRMTLLVRRVPAGYRPGAIGNESYRVCQPWHAQRIGGPEAVDVDIELALELYFDPV